MTWRGSTDAKDRLFAALPYLLPLFYALPFGRFLFAQFPVLEVLLIPLQPLFVIFGIVPFAGLIVFFVLFLAVVRNERICHFVRYNTMQAILLDILLILLSLISSLLVRGLGSTFLIETLYNVIFLGTLAACVYGVVQCVRGLYPEIPAISEAVYSQVR